MKNRLVKLNNNIKTTAILIVAIPLVVAKHITEKYIERGRK